MFRNIITIYFLNVQSCHRALSHFLANHTVLRSRECILEGTQVHWSDRVFCDGEVYLTLDHTDHWTPHVPQAVDLGDLLGREEQRTQMERIRLQEGCVKLMKELRLSKEHSGTLYVLSDTGKTNMGTISCKTL